MMTSGKRLKPVPLSKASIRIRAFSRDLFPALLRQELQCSPAILLSSERILPWVSFSSPLMTGEDESLISFRISLSEFCGSDATFSIHFSRLIFHLGEESTLSESSQGRVPAHPPPKKIKAQVKRENTALAVLFVSKNMVYLVSYHTHRMLRLGRSKMPEFPRHQIRKTRLFGWLALCVCPGTIASANSPGPNSITSVTAPELEYVSLTSAGLPKAEYSAGARANVFGGSVFIPRPVGYRGYREAVGEECAAPRFSSPRATAAGWSVGRVVDPDPFEPRSGCVRELFFFILPRSPSSSGKIFREVDSESYHRWLELCSEPEPSRRIGELVVEASSKWLGGSPPSCRLKECEGGTNAGFPFVAGTFRLVDFRERVREFRFAAAVTMIGKTWALSVSVASADSPKREGETAMSMARAAYYLNRDFRVSGKTKKETLGPFGWKAGG